MVSIPWSDIQNTARRRHLGHLAAILFCSAGTLAVLAISKTEPSRGSAGLRSDDWQRLESGLINGGVPVEESGEGVVLLAEANAEDIAALAPRPMSAVQTRPALPADAGEGDPARREALVRQAIDYDARRPKTVIELQKFRSTQVARIADKDGKPGRAVLVALNPRSNAWYLLELTWDGGKTVHYHLSNGQPETHRLMLDSEFPGGLVLASAAGRENCALWSDESSSSLAIASRQLSPYVPLCKNQVALRRPTEGRRTRLEWAADFLRDNVPSGEEITVMVRDKVFKDSHLSQGELTAGAAGPEAAAQQRGVPLPARIVPGRENDLLAPVDLGLALESPQDKLQVGTWTAARGNAGVFVSALEPALAAAPGPLPAARRIAALDEVEAGALTLMVAFDLSRFELGFAIGTDHPRVGWSDRVQPGQRDDSLPGPDGIGDIAPLVAGGMVPFPAAERTTATFTAGFKRSHGAFKSGELAGRNFGSHYGFIESGVVLSKLQPGLATVYVLDDGSVGMKTWTREDDALLERIEFARQNGVPIVETDPATGKKVPGALVAKWAAGNWSGSQDKRLRSLRAGICLQESAAGRFLVYGYFSSATPSAMARVFAAYGCSYAMTTDMNALEHTYLALYRVEDSKLAIDHLITGMNVLDQVVDGKTLPRFLAFADNRDFFYLARRPAPAPAARPAATRPETRPEAAPEAVPATETRAGK